MAVGDGGAPDLAGCFGGRPDEDNDSFGNACDVCAADPEPTGPTDADHDGVPDQCDPDPNTPGNRLLYFEPFDADPGHWSEPNGTVVTSGYLVLNTSASSTPSLTSSNMSDLLPANVRLESWVYVFPAEAGADASTGIFLGPPAAASAQLNGVLCSVNYHANQPADTVDVTQVVNGQLSTTTQSVAIPVSQPNQVGFPFQQLARLRLTQRGNTYVCELGVLNSANNSVNVLATTPTLTAATPSGNQFMLLRATNQEGHFHSVVAETTTP
jgi:hypothetical protein